jgi:hypothetical protein
MEIVPIPHVIALDRLHGGLFIYFSDGSSGFYSASMLFSVLEKAEKIRIPESKDSN